MSLINKTSSLFIVIIMCVLTILASCSTSSVNNTYSSSSCYEIEKKERALAQAASKKAEKDYDKKWFWQRKSCPNPTFMSKMYIEQCEGIYEQPIEFFSCKTGFDTTTGLGERIVWDKCKCDYICEEYCSFVPGTKCKVKGPDNYNPKSGVGTITDSTTCRITGSGTLSCSTITYD